MFEVGGVPTSLTLVLDDVSTGVQAHSPAAVGFFGLLPENQPLAQPTPTITSATISPAPTAPWICRRRRAAAARRAIWRSALARASARCRFLLEATGAPSKPA